MAAHSTAPAAIRLSIVSFIAGVVTGVGGLLMEYHEYAEQRLGADLSGVWLMEMQIEDASNRKLPGIRLMYMITIAQSGLAVVGSGRKTCEFENGRWVQRRGESSTQVEILRGRVTPEFTKIMRYRVGVRAVDYAYQEHSQTTAFSIGYVHLEPTSTSILVGRGWWSAGNAVASVRLLRRPRTLECNAAAQEMLASVER